MSRILPRILIKLLLGCFLFPLGLFLANAKTQLRKEPCVPTAAKGSIRVGDVQGSIKFYPMANGHGGVNVRVRANNLPSGSYEFRVHELPTKGTNCTSAGGDLNTNHGIFPCNKKDLANCELGDLSGKSHPLQGGPSTYVSFVDKFLSITDVIGRSFVIHDPALRIICSTIVGFYVVDGQEKRC